MGNPIPLASFFAGVGGFDRGFEATGRFTTVTQCEVIAGRRDTLAKNFPHVPTLLGDIRDVTAPQITGDPDVWTAGFPCFPAGTLIATESGLKPIEQIETGEQVVTHLRRLRPVVETMSRTDAPTVTVKIMGAAPVVTTDEHPFYVRTKGREWDNEKRSYRRVWTEPEWVAAKDLTFGHFAAMPLDDDGQETIGEPLAYLIGRWLGDGWIVDHPRTGRQRTRNSRVHKAIICCNRDEALDVAGAIGAAGYHGTRSDEATVTKFHVSSKELVERLRDFGRYAHGKRVPAWVYDLTRDEQSAMLSGWLDADGHRSKAGAQVTGVTISAELAYGMARVARNVTGRAVSLTTWTPAETTVIEGRTVNQRPQYRVHISHRNREAFAADGYVWVPVRSVTPNEGTATVYNIGVEEDESYVAWGIAVHNCKQLSVAAPHRQGLDGKDSRLLYDFYRLVDAYLALVAQRRPRFVVLENTPGLLRSRQGRDMAAVVMGLEELGYGWAYRVVNGASLGTPQERRRVVVVGHLGGDPRPAGAVLGLPGSGCEAAPPSDRGVTGPGPHAGPAVVGGEVVRVWRKSANSQVSIERGYEGGYRETWVNDGRMNTLTSADAGNAARQKHLVAQGGRIRTLTPVEWERASGFPDGWTEPLSHNARMQALGDTFHVGTATWLADRLAGVYDGLAAHPRIFDAPAQERHELAAVGDQYALFA